jgi:mannose-6-phosphate isomerase-like protein (cupin superfamily)
MGSSREFALVGVRMKLQLSKEQTGGAFSLFENKSSGVSRTPIHTHAFEDETLYMMEGEMRAIIAGKEEVARPGDAVFLPRGIPHQLVNESGEAAHYLLLCTPGGFEHFIEKAGSVITSGSPVEPPTHADIERLKDAAPGFGIKLLSAWPIQND